MLERVEMEDQERVSTWAEGKEMQGPEGRKEVEDWRRASQGKWEGKRDTVKWQPGLQKADLMTCWRPGLGFTVIPGQVFVQGSDLI